MRLRDAVPDDADRLAALARRGAVTVDVSERSLRDMIHDRTVVVAEAEEEAGAADDGDGERGGDGDDDGDDPGDGSDGAGAEDRVVGYVSYDVDDGTVVIHHLVAEPGGGALERLLTDPVGFADREGLPAVTGLPPDGEAADVAEDAGFEAVERRLFGDGEVVRYERPAPEA